MFSPLSVRLFDSYQKGGIVSGKNLRIVQQASLILLAVCLLAGNANAQYFGQNKVRYKSHDFKVLKTEHFDIHYYDEKKDAAAEFGRMAERWLYAFALGFQS